MSDSADQSGRHQPWQQQQQPMHHLHPSILLGSSNFQQETTMINLKHHQQHHQQNFLLSVLLLQKDLQQKQHQQHQQPQHGPGQWHQWNDPSMLPLAHLQRPLLTSQPPFLPNNNYSNNNNNNNDNDNIKIDKNDKNPPPPRSLQQNQDLQQQSETGIWTEAVDSLIRSAEEPRKQHLSGLRIVSTRLDRQSTEQPWGLGFVSNHNSYNPNTIYNNNDDNNTHVRNAITMILFGRRIIVVKSPISIANQRSSPEDWSNGILPGDIILAIDGKPVSSWCADGNTNANSNANSQVQKQKQQNPQPKKIDNTTAEIATYLRSIRTVSITVLRHSETTKASAIAVSSDATSVATPRDANNNQQSPCHGPYRISSIANVAWNRLLVPPSLVPAPGAPKTKSKAKASKKDAFVVYRNPLYWQIDKQGKKVNIPYEDNQGSLEYELYLQEDGSRAGLFLPPIPTDRTGFCGWLSERKTTWRSRYNVYKFAADSKKPKKKAAPDAKTKSTIPKDKQEIDDSEGPVANADFWTQQGFTSFDDWLRNRSIQWHRSYSWNRLKRQKIEEECFQKVVFLPLTNHHTSNYSGNSSCSTEEFHEWLKARRVQWRMFRRKRKRHSTIDDSLVPGILDSPRCVSSFARHEEGTKAKGRPITTGKRKLQFLSEEDQQMAFIDEILEEKEKETQELLRKRAERPPIDIIRFFDAAKGIPDDVVAHCFAYIDPREHGKLLVINRAVSKLLKDRHGVWQMLCPAQWILPRRPRKPWHEIYLSRLRKERERHQKRWDDLLLKCSSALFKRDDLQKVEKLIEKAETEFGFDVNYASGVVCERNSILNLAVLQGRYKVVRWLVDTKHADIETSDRGNFTPLLNAAWSGDRWLVRFFLQRKSNRLAKGTQHYTQGIAPPGFEGNTAEEWAEHRNHPEIAKLIRLGL